MTYDFIISDPPFDLIRATYLSPNNLPWTEGFDPDPEMVYVEVWKADTYMGCFSFSRTDDPTIVGVHTTLLPVAYGQAVQIGKEVIRWLALKTPFKTLRTLGSYENPLIMRLLRKTGFVDLGFYKDWFCCGITHHLHIFELPIS